MTGPDGIVFPKVWLTHEAPRAGFRPKRFVGSLWVGPAGFSFTSPSHSFQVPRGQWAVMAFGAAGSDVVNSWAHVRFTDAAGRAGEAFLNDGRFLGWGGIFGGAKKLAAALSR